MKYGDVEARLTGKLEVASMRPGTTKDPAGFLRDSSGKIVGTFGWGHPVPFAKYRLVIESVSDVKARKLPKPTNSSAEAKDKTCAEVQQPLKTEYRRDVIFSKTGGKPGTGKTGDRRPGGTPFRDHGFDFVRYTQTVGAAPFAVLEGCAYENLRSAPGVALQFPPCSSSSAIHYADTTDAEICISSLRVAIAASPFWELRKLVMFSCRYLNKYGENTGLRLSVSS
jgi:hypothetical protein